MSIDRQLATRDPQVLHALPSRGIYLLVCCGEAWNIAEHGLLPHGGLFMRTMIAGLSGWVRMQDGRSESIRVVDTAITIVATLLAAVTWAMLHH
jgi:hypothetical protein